MQTHSHVLHEIRRLQILIFVSRIRRSPAAPALVSDLAAWLGVPMDECVRLLGELQSEELVETDRGESATADPQIRLSVIGAGWLTWVDRLSSRRAC